MEHQYLFAAIPNNSGSTVLHSALARCENVSALPGEGQDYFGAHGKRRHFQRTLGPHTLRVGFDRQATVLEGLYRDPVEYDWPRIKKRWHKEWDLSKPVLFEKTPANVIRAEMLQREFPGSSFILGIRNPYATIEGVMRKAPYIGPREAAKSWVRCAQLQRDNERYLCNWVFLKYEEMVDSPDEAGCRLRDLTNGHLDDLNFDGEYRVDNVAGTNYLTNLNAVQILNLTSWQLGEINRVMIHYERLMELFEYHYITQVVG